MDADQFAGLQPGNTITDASRKLMVHRILKNPTTGHTFAIGVLEAFDNSDAAALTIIGTSFVTTFVQGQADGSIEVVDKTTVGE